MVPVGLRPARMNGQRLWNRARVLVSLLVFVGGINLQARAHLATSSRESAYVFFWCGIVLCLVSATSIGGNRYSSLFQRVLGLLLIGGALYLPVFLRSPELPTFQDELFHIQTLELMRDLKTSQVPITFYPIAGNFPGLEYVGLATLYTTQASIMTTVRFLALGLHVITPVIAFYAYRTVGLRSFTAFYASLFYIANVGYFYFFSTFSYGTLGIVLFLYIVMLAHRKNCGDRGGSVEVSALLLLSLFSIVVAHHMSSAIAILYLYLLLVVSFVVGRRPALSNVATYALVLWFSWLAYQAVRSVSYLYSNLAPRVVSILEFMLKEQNQIHPLFLNSQLPLGERIIAYMYPILLFVLCALSFLTMFHKKRYPMDHPDFLSGYLTLALFGPLTWFALGPLVLSNSAEVVYRVSPYVFIGVGFYAALYVGEWSRKGGILRQLVLVSLTLVVLAGGIIIGDNQAGRFTSKEVHYAGGPEVLTADIIHAAEWLKNEHGRFNLTVGDMMSSIAFSVFGMQRTDLYATWEPFYTPDPSTAQMFMDENHVDYLVVDLRDGRYPPRYRYYFNQAELYDESLQTRYLDETFPSYLLTKFDNIQRLQRIYDNGDIVIYENGHLSETAFPGSGLSPTP